MIEFEIEPEGGDKYELIADSRDVLIWERTAKGKDASFTVLMDNLQMVELYRLAHIAARRTGMFAGTLAEFEQQCVLHFDEAAGSGVDPTRPAASAGSSSASPSSPESPRPSGRKKATGRSKQRGTS